MTLTSINPHLLPEVLDEAGPRGSVVALADKAFRARNTTAEEGRNGGTGNRSGA